MKFLILIRILSSHMRSPKFWRNMLQGSWWDVAVATCPCGYWGWLSMRMPWRTPFYSRPCGRVEFWNLSRDRFRTRFFPVGAAEVTDEAVSGGSDSWDLLYRNQDGPGKGGEIAVLSPHRQYHQWQTKIHPMLFVQTIKLSGGDWKMRSDCHMRFNR